MGARSGMITRKRWNGSCRGNSSHLQPHEGVLRRSRWQRRNVYLPNEVSVPPPGAPSPGPASGARWGGYLRRGHGRLADPGALQQKGRVITVPCRQKAFSQVPLDCVAPGIPAPSWKGEEHPSNTRYWYHLGEGELGANFSGVAFLATSVVRQVHTHFMHYAYQLNVHMHKRRFPHSVTLEHGEMALGIHPGFEMCRKLPRKRSLGPAR